MNKKTLAFHPFGLAFSFFMLTLAACGGDGSNQSSKPENVVMQSEKPLVEPQSPSSGKQAEWTRTASYEDVVSSVNSDEVSKTNTLATKAMVKNLSKGITIDPNSLTAPDIPLSGLLSPYSAYDKRSAELEQYINLNEIIFDIDYIKKSSIQNSPFVNYYPTGSYDVSVNDITPEIKAYPPDYWFNQPSCYGDVARDCGAVVFTDLKNFDENIHVTYRYGTMGDLELFDGKVTKFYYLDYALPRGMSLLTFDRNTANNYALYEVDCSTRSSHFTCKVTKIDIPDTIKAKLPKVPNEPTKYVDLLDANNKPLEDPSKHKDFLGYSIRFKPITGKKESFPFKLKRKLIWIEDESALAEAGQDRPVYMYPGYGFSMGISTTTGVADSVGTNWSKEVGISSTNSTSNTAGGSLTVTVGAETEVGAVFAKAKASISISGTASYSHTWSNSTTNSNSSTNGGSTNRTTNSQRSTTKTYNFSPPNVAADGNNNYMRQFTYWKLLETWELQKPDGSLLNDSDLRGLLFTALSSINSVKKGLEPNYEALLCAKYNKVYTDKDGNSYQYSKNDCSQLKPRIDYAIDQMRLTRQTNNPTGVTGTYSLIRTADDIATKNFANGSVELRNVVHTIDWRRSDMVDMLTGIWNNSAIGTTSSIYFIIDNVNINTKTFNLTYAGNKYLGSYQNADKMVLVPLAGTAQNCTTPPSLSWTWASKTISLSPGNCNLLAGWWKSSTWSKQ